MRVHPWVIIDDFGLSATSPTMAGMMDRIIDARYQAVDAGGRTLLTTNLQPSQMSMRTESRFLDKRRVRSITIKAPDYRQTPIVTN